MYWEFGYIGNLTHLNYLGLQNNQLSGSIPESIGSLHELRSLWLRNNRLSGTIPTEIGTLTSQSLETVDLSNNFFVGGITPAHFGTPDSPDMISYKLDRNCLNDLNNETLNYISGISFGIYGTGFTFYPQKTQQECAVVFGDAKVNKSLMSIGLPPKYDASGNRLVTRELLKNEEIAGVSK